MVCGNVVISIDFFKKFVSGITVDRRRSRQQLRIIDRPGKARSDFTHEEQAATLDANYVFNVKMETSSISKGRRDSIGSVEVLAYGTADHSIQHPQTELY